MDVSTCRSACQNQRCHAFDSNQHTKSASQYLDFHTCCSMGRLTGRLIHTLFLPTNLKTLDGLDDVFFSRLPLRRKWRSADLGLVYFLCSRSPVKLDIFLITYLYTMECPDPKTRESVIIIIVRTWYYVSSLSYRVDTLWLRSINAKLQSSSFATLPRVISVSGDLPIHSDTYDDLATLFGFTFLSVSRNTVVIFSNVEFSLAILASSLVALRPLMHGATKLITRVYERRRVRPNVPESPPIYLNERELSGSTPLVADGDMEVGIPSPETPRLMLRDTISPRNHGACAPL